MAEAGWMKPLWEQGGSGVNGDGWGGQFGLSTDLTTCSHSLLAIQLFPHFVSLNRSDLHSAVTLCSVYVRRTPAAVSDLIKAQQSAFHNTHHHFSSDVTCNAAAVHQGSLPCGKLPAGLCESLTWGGLKPRDRPPVFAACVMRPQTAQRTGPPHTGASKHDQPNQN